MRKILYIIVTCFCMYGFLREVFLFSGCYSPYNSFLFYALACIDINALIYIISKEG